MEGILVCTYHSCDRHLGVPVYGKSDTRSVSKVVRSLAYQIAQGLYFFCTLLPPSVVLVVGLACWSCGIRLCPLWYQTRPPLPPHLLLLYRTILLPFTLSPGTLSHAYYSHSDATLRSISRRTPRPRLACACSPSQRWPSSSCASRPPGFHCSNRTYHYDA